LHPTTSRVAFRLLSRSRAVSRSRSWSFCRSIAG